LVGGEGGVEEGEGVVVGEGEDAVSGGAGGVEVGGHVAFLLPESPGDAGGGVAVGVAVVGEGVEVGVGGGVVGLAGVAEGAGEAGEEDEVGEVGVVFGELVEVVGGVGFGVEDGGEVLGGEGGDCGVVEGGGGVDYCGEGVLWGDLVEELGELLGVGDVAGGDGGGGSVFLEFVFELGCSGGVVALSAGEDEVLCVVFCGEVFGDELAEGSGAAGDEDCAVGVEGLGDGEDDFAGVFGLAEVSECLGGVVDVVGGGGEGFDVVFVEECLEFLEVVG
jgi:hypothetical protein